MKALDQLDSVRRERQKLAGLVLAEQLEAADAQAEMLIRLGAVSQNHEDVVVSALRELVTKVIALEQLK